MASPGASAVLLLLLAVAGDPPAAPPAASPRPPVAAVVAAVAKSAAENAALPEKERVAGDALFDRYVRAAAAAADGDRRSFLLGLGHAVDPGRTLEKFNVTAKEFKDVETAEARAARLADLGRPTLRGRSDHVLHFAVSAALADHSGSPVAETLGLVKERLDAVREGGSGFSFADVLADRAGIRFAAWLADAEKGAARVKALAADFSGAAFMPDASAEREGLTLEQFEKEFGSFQDERFLAAMRRMGAALDALEVYGAAAEGEGGKGGEEGKDAGTKPAGEPPPGTGRTGR